MGFTNADRWLLELKDGDVTFGDIKRVIGEIPGSDKFDYDTSRGRHAVFHMVLDDLDTLCRSGEATRTFRKESDIEVEEIFSITPKGIARAEKL